MNNVLAAQPGEYIKGAIVANVSGAKALTSKSGKTFFKATLSEGGVTVDVTSFSKTFEHVNGQRVQFSGQGIKRGDDYRGGIQLTFGDKVVFKPVSEATTTQPAPVAEEPRKTQGTASNGPSGPQHASNGRIEGVTVGMALNKAVDICMFEGPDSINSERLWRTASMIIRVAQELQSGNLAPVTATNDVPSQEVPF
jgi:hypothetical protein